jgi:alkylation response protein AidB-like acyl-CoA dehydrogenase
VPQALWLDLRGRGYLSLAAPVKYGGRGVPFARYLELMEQFAMSHASLRMIVHVANGVWRAIDQLATDAQREQFVLPQVAGDIWVAFTLTEPDAGTGADLRCRVVQEEDTYFLSGRKHLITFGVHCDYWLLFARREGTRGADGTVALMVDRHAPGASAYITGQTLVVGGGLSHRGPAVPGGPDLALVQQLRVITGALPSATLLSPAGPWSVRQRRGGTPTDHGGIL